MLVHWEKKIGKGVYKLARVTKVHPDVHGRVRTVTVGFRGKDSGKTLPYISKPLQEMKIGVQRVAVICPIEEQVSDSDKQEESRDSETTAE